MSSILFHPSSYRDPSGSIFEKDGVLYRQVNNSFREHFDQFIKTGCYDHLVKNRLLIPHADVHENYTGSAEWYKTIQPEKIAYVSFPYEWSFDMLKDAALLTLQLVKESVSFGMILKDATPYNIQWHRGKFIFIDTLSFEKYNEQPWIAYRQFCESFLGPLLIMHYSRKQLPQLMAAWPNGIPLEITRSLLPSRSRFSFYTYMHIHLHAKISGGKKGKGEPTTKLSKQKLLNLLTSLEIVIKRLKTPVQQTTWSAYYEEATQRNDYIDQKKKIVGNWATSLQGIKTAIDLGANEGVFSKLLAEKGISILTTDADPYCINRLYNSIKYSNEQNLQPLIIDLTDPSPAIGVNNEERGSFIQRTNTDLVLALALVHHLAIGKNIPLKMIAGFFSRLGKKLIIEFVPKKDDKVQLMLRSKPDIYTSYSEENFVADFENYFSVEEKLSIPGSGRKLYLMNKK